MPMKFTAYALLLSCGLLAWISCFCSCEELALPVSLGMTRIITCPNACNTYPADLMTCL